MRKINVKLRTPLIVVENQTCIVLNGEVMASVMSNARSIKLSPSIIFRFHKNYPIILDIEKLRSMLGMHVRMDVACTRVPLNTPSVQRARKESSYYLVYYHPLLPLDRAHTQWIFSSNS